LKKTVLVTLTVAAMLITGCASTEPATAEAPAVSVEPAAPSPTPTPTPTPTGPPVNERGQVIMKIGKTGAWANTPEGEPVIKFKVTSIQPIECGEYSPKPVGMAIAVALEVETTPELEGNLTIDGQPGYVSFDSHHWKGYAPNGTRMNQVDGSVTYNCRGHEGEMLPNEISKGEKASGIVVLDVTTPKGEVAYENVGLSWIWKYPSK
jgi:hypothetical protein